MIRVLVVDDHALFRRGLSRVLEEAGLEVVGEAGDGAEAMRLAAELGPDVVLMDLHMPGVDGVEATRALGARFPVLALTVSEDDEDLVRAVQAGARGYLIKRAEPEELARAVRAVAAGQSALSPEMTVPALEALRHTPRRWPARLSPRQRQVLAGILQGHSNRRIAEALAISPHTVRTHVERLYEQLGVSSRTELIRLATARRLDVAAPDRD